MRRILPLALIACLVEISPAQTFGGPLSPSVPIPDGLQGPCAFAGQSLMLNVTVPNGVAPIASITVGIGVTHSYYGDVTFTLMAPTGAMVSLLGPTAPCAGFGDSSDLGGLYAIDDNAAMSFDNAALAAGAAQAIPLGAYQGDALLMPVFGGINPAGTWTFIFQDIALNDTGVVTHTSLTLNCQSESYTISQPGGPGSPVLFANMGCPGETFLRLVVLGQAGVPNGWFFGMNITYPEIVAEIGFGYPFSGILPPSGIDVFALPAGAVPPSTMLSSVGFHFDLSGFPILIQSAVTYTVQ